MPRKQYLLRIDPELWNELEKWAADDLRSVNAQVEWLLREAVCRRRGGRAGQDRASHSAEEEHEDDSATSPRGSRQEYGRDEGLMPIVDPSLMLRGGRK